MRLLVVRAGPMTTVQGLPRTGLRDCGVPAGGAADRAAMTLADALAGNAPGSAVLETALAGPTLRAVEGGAWVALAGGPWEVRLDGRSRPWPGAARAADGVTTLAVRSLWLPEGGTLDVRGGGCGARLTIAVPGGVTEVTDASGATLRRGRRLTDGCVVACGAGVTPADLWTGQVAGLAAAIGLPCGDRDGDLRGGHDGGRGDPRGPFVLRVLPGAGAPGHGEGWAGLLSRSWTVDGRSDRMGLRLAGEPLPAGAEVASEPVVPGVVQIAGDGRPIVLGPDAQTIGGYPKAAAVIGADLDVVGRLRPGDAVRFVGVSPAEADAARRSRAGVLRRWAAVLSP